MTQDEVAAYEDFGTRDPDQYKHIKREADAITESLSDLFTEDTVKLPDVADVSFPSMIGAIDPVKKKRRKKPVQYRGVTLGRRPTDFEAHVLSLSEIPRRFDIELSRTVGDLVEARRSHAELVLTDTAGADDRAKERVGSILREAQDRMSRYGAFELRQECARQGMHLSVPPETDFLYARPSAPTPFDAALETTAKALTQHLTSDWSSVVTRVAAKADRMQQPRAKVIRLAETRIESGLKTAVRQLLNEAFALSRREEIRRIARTATCDATVISLAKRAAKTVDEDDLEDMVDYVIQTAVMDNATCEPCADADGRTFDYDDDEMLEHQPPYYKCLGGDNCRCVQVYVLKTGGSWIVR